MKFESVYLKDENLIFLTVAVIIVVWLLARGGKDTESKESLYENEDDMRENIMYYDEEGAGLLILVIFLLKFLKD